MTRLAFLVVFLLPSLALAEGAPADGLIDPARVGVWALIASVVAVGLRQLLKVPRFGQCLDARGPLVKRVVTLLVSAVVGALSGWLGGQSWGEAISVAVSTVLGATYLFEQGKPLANGKAPTAPAAPAEPAAAPPPAEPPSAPPAAGTA